MSYSSLFVFFHCIIKKIDHQVFGAAGIAPALSETVKVQKPTTGAVKSKMSIPPAPEEKEWSLGYQSWRVP